MRVILLDNLKGIGQIGDAKDVNDGYARNFLFPRKLAKLATPATLQEAEKLKQKRSLLLQQEQQRAQEAADRLKDLTITFNERASETGTLFAAIGKRELIKKIKELTNIALEQDMFHLDEPIKTLGEHKVTLKLAPDITVQIPVQVIPPTN